MMALHTEGIHRTHSLNCAFFILDASKPIGL